MLKFNPERMFELLMELKEATPVKMMFKQLEKDKQTMEKDKQMMKKDKQTMKKDKQTMEKEGKIVDSFEKEVYARKILIGLICANTGGQRPGFTTNMTIENFRKAKDNVVKVLNPTKTKHMKLQFERSLFNALDTYIQIFRHKNILWLLYYL